ncbi:UbiA prenyltransferase family-domain-containing protein [Astrocystis sublimbata]|nr:UbiA prenyltransferase family-domain-containing protein [Astrocystis sublimbata]
MYHDRGLAISFTSVRTSLSEKQSRHTAFAYTSWRFVESDMFTFAIPNTAFGILSALAMLNVVDARLSSPKPSEVTILSRLPYVLAFNIGNLYIFDLANQRSPHSVVEDKINKPWRPIPQGRITMNQTRRLMLGAIPTVLLLNYALDTWQQGVLINIISWMYNDLGGGDEPFLREILIAIAYGLFNGGSLSIAAGIGSTPTLLGLTWTAIVSCVILTTMQIQDLKDQSGDRTRNRKTIALFVGERISRVSIAFFVCFWSCICGSFWSAGPMAMAFIILIAFVIALRVLLLSSPRSDARTWRIWCFWHASLYVLPALAIGNT